MNLVKICIYLYPIFHATYKGSMKITKAHIKREKNSIEEKENNLTHTEQLKKFNTSQPTTTQCKY